ncbi:MAG TPA: archaellin/type IV pilin N-terminal domain-containing protein [Thermoplasmata archaeon]|nr:archaellin/type IV pilin N-terminal domain-containing protein [Thermoplasmata archaeon]
MSLRSRSRSGGRRRSRSGVSEIVATILLVAITVVLAAVLYVLVSGLTRAPGTTPIGSAFTLGTVHEATSGTGASQRWYYNSSVQAAGGGIAWGNMIFQVQAGSGSVVATGPMTITVTNAASSCNLATYSFSSATWGTPPVGACSSVPVGPNAAVVTGAALQLLSTASLQQSGISLVAFGQGPYSGSEAFALP